MASKFYVSLVKDLIGYYLEFEAEDEMAVLLHIKHEYKTPEGICRLPWCSIYTEEEIKMQIEENNFPVNIIKSRYTTQVLRKEDFI